MGFPAVCHQAGHGEGGWCCNPTTLPRAGHEGDDHDKRYQQDNLEPDVVVETTTP